MVYELTRNRLKMTRQRAEKYIDRNLESWVREIGLPIVRSRARSKGLSEFSVDKITTQKEGFMFVKIIWDLKTEDGKPLDEFLENGTAPHIIERKFKQVLSDGETIFGTKVRHPGTKPMNIFKDSNDEVISIITKKVEDETSRFLDMVRVQ